MHRIWAIVEPENAASARVLEKVGLQREGRLRDHRYAKGRWRDSVLRHPRPGVGRGAPSA